MVHIIITEAGREKVIDDIRPYLEERDQVLAKLESIYAGFGDGQEELLVPQESEIVELVNRFHELDSFAAIFDAKLRSIENVKAGQELIRSLREKSK